MNDNEPQKPRRRLTTAAVRDLIVLTGIILFAGGAAAVWGIGHGAMAAGALLIALTVVGDRKGPPL